MPLSANCCTWTWDQWGCMWETECGESFVFIDGCPLKPSEKKFEYCPYCGQKIQEIGFGDWLEEE